MKICTFKIHPPKLSPSTILWLKSVMMDVAETDGVVCQDIECFESFIHDIEKRGIGARDGVFKVKFDSQCLKKNSVLLSIVHGQPINVHCQVVLKGHSENIFQYKKNTATKQACTLFLEESARFSSYNLKSCCSTILEENGCYALLQHYFENVIPEAAQPSGLDVDINNLLRQGKELHKTYISEDVDQLADRLHRKEEVTEICNCPDCDEERTTDVATSNVPFGDIHYAAGITLGDNAKPIFVTEKFSLSRIKNILMLLNNQYPGVTSSYFYLGQNHSFFALHNEDASLWSINYLHLGQPKIWIVVPPEGIILLMYHLSKSGVSMGNTSCWNFLGHKIALPTPVWLKERNIPFKVVVQQAGEAVVLYPDAAHFGFNTGWNLAEAINFGTVSWIEHGMQSLRCQCIPGQIHLDLRTIVAAFRPHLLSDWLKGHYVANSKEAAIINFLSKAAQAHVKEPSNTENPTSMKFLDCPVSNCSKKYPFSSKNRLDNHVLREHRPLVQKLNLLELIAEQHKKLKHN